MKKKINSKIKGKVGELEWVKFCREQGFDDVRRSKQYCGHNPDASDCVGLPGIYQEVKRVEHLQLDTAIRQAAIDSDTNIPMVAHRKNHTAWKVTMYADDWFRLYRKWLETL